MRAAPNTGIALGGQLSDWSWIRKSLRSFKYKFVIFCVCITVHRLALHEVTRSQSADGSVVGQITWISWWYFVCAAPHMCASWGSLVTKWWWIRNCSDHINKLVIFRVCSTAGLRFMRWPGRRVTMSLCLVRSLDCLSRLALMWMRSAVTLERWVLLVVK